MTLALSPAQSERFVFAQEFGHVWLANEPATVTDDGTKLITLGHTTWEKMKVNHVWNVVPDGTHSFPVWKNDLYLFAQMVFQDKK